MRFHSRCSSDASWAAVLATSGGVFPGLLPRYKGDYGVIAFPYIGALIGGASGCLMAVVALLRLRRR